MLSLPVVRHFRARPRLLFSIAAGSVLYWLIPGDARFVTRALIAWDAAVAFHLLLIAVMIARSDQATIRQRAAIEDEGRYAFLLVSTAAAIMSLISIFAELAKGTASPGNHGPEIILAVATVFLSWLFMHTTFALLYAHDYYGGSDKKPDKGLDFPGEDNPDYWDFLYFAYIIGTSAQTADVGISGRRLRRIAIFHSVLAFFFNTTVLALTINTASGLFQ